MRQQTRTQHPPDPPERRVTSDPELGRTYLERIGARTMAVMAEAAARTPDSGLEEEIGALRIVLARLLNEEADLDRLALNVARIADSTVRVVRAHRDVSGPGGANVVLEMQAILAEIAEDTGVKP